MQEVGVTHLTLISDNVLEDFCSSLTLSLVGLEVLVPGVGREDSPTENYGYIFN